MIKSQRDSARYMRDYRKQFPEKAALNRCRDAIRYVIKYLENHPENADDMAKLLDQLSKTIGVLSV